MGLVYLQYSPVVGRHTYLSACLINSEQTINRTAGLGVYCVVQRASCVGISGGEPGDLRMRVMPHYFIYRLQNSLP